MPGDRTWWRPLPAALFARVDGASLVVFRIAFGALALWEVWRYADNGWIDEYYLEPVFRFTYDGFSWVRPWPGEWLHAHFFALGVLAVCILVGFCYRLAAALFFVGFSYVFLLEKANYLNHLYLFCLLAFLAIFLPAHRALSIDAWLRPALRSEDAPAWAVWLLRFQMGVVYFFAGVAKISPDWLAGWPLRLWLPPEDDCPVIGRFFHDLWFQLLFSWGGLLLDLLGPFFLLWSRTRWLAFAFMVFFHLTNARLFGIGIFPWLSLAATLPFFPPDWPRRVFNWPRRTPQPPAAPPSGPLTRGQYAAAIALAAWVAVQLTVPLRHLLYPGEVNWTEEGHNFAWHQKLRDKSAEAVFFVTDPASGQRFEVDPGDTLTSRQEHKMASRPHMVLEFAHHLARDFEARLGRPVEVRAEVMCSLNAREPQLLIDPEVDLAREPRGQRHKPWILPLREPLPAEVPDEILGELPPELLDLIPEEVRDEVYVFPEGSGD
jgi:hypothetical protein